jgi:hypothetical protein
MAAAQKMAPVELEPKEEALPAIDRLATSLKKQIAELDAEDRGIAEQLAKLLLKRDEVTKKRTALQTTLGHLVEVWRVTADASMDIPSWVKPDPEKR